MLIILSLSMHYISNYKIYNHEISRSLLRNPAVCKICHYDNINLMAIETNSTFILVVRKR